MQIFTLLSFLCISIGAVILGFVMSSACRAGFESLERSLTGAYVSQQFHEHFDDSLFKQPDALRDPETLAALKDSLSFANVFRIKLYGPSGVVLWSDEVELIQRTFPNRLLRRALGGAVVSEIEEPTRQEHEFEHEHDLVQEVYVPIYSRNDGVLLGVIEVYRTPEIYIKAVRRAVWLSWSVSVGGGICLYIVLLAVVRGAYRKEKRLERELQSHSEDLLREAEKLTTIVGAIGAGLCVLDKDGKITWFNGVMERWFGPADRINGRSCDEVFYQGGDPPDRFPTSLSNHTGVPYQCHCTLPSGEQRWIEVTPTPLREAGNRIAGELVLVVDVTERKAMNTRLVQAGKMAALGELAGSVVHEINNPVGVISLRVTNLLDILGPDIDEARIRTALEEVKLQVERISLTAGELLSFARQSVGERQIIDLHDTIKEAIHLVEHRVADERVRFSLRLSDRACTVNGDVNALQQVFVNLLSNAIDALPKGGVVTIRTGVTRAATGRDQVVVAIEDNGVGMQPHVRDKIFDFFFTTKPKGRGTGLGLPISRRIVAEHEGEISVTSEPGSGSRFEIALPLAVRLVRNPGAES